MSTSQAGGASIPGSGTGTAYRAKPDYASAVVWVVFTICLVVVLFGVSYLQKTWLGLALTFAGVLVGYESVYLMRKLTKRRTTD